MNEQFILAFIPDRVRQLGYQGCHLRYREYFIKGKDTLTIAAWTQLFFLVGEPAELLIDSDYGQYNTSISGNTENTYQHKGEITITNTSETAKRIKFIQVILIY